MFVRLFVDENLDRMVPISRQPKEKIQAIIDSCSRQFPEYGERSRKRIRTYLKSCRRTRRQKGFMAREAAPSSGGGGGGAGALVPSPAAAASYHLSSPLAEQILSTACENEFQNAKRMRLGFKPLAVPDVGGEVGELVAMNGKSTSSLGCNSLTATSTSAVQMLKGTPAMSLPQHNSNTVLAAFCNQGELISYY